MTDCTWTNGNATDVWDDPDNWDNGTPAVGDNVIFNGAVSNDSITVDAVAGVFGTLTIKGNYTGTMTLAVNIEFTAMDVGNVSASNFTIAGNGYTIDVTTLDIDTGDTLNIGGGVTIDMSGALTCDGSLIPATDAVIKPWGGTTITGILGAADTNYTLFMKGTLATSSGTLIAPNASGSFTFAGSSWNTPTTFTHSSGKVTFDGTATLANDSTDFYDVLITGSLSTHETNNYALSASGAMTVEGTLNCNASTTSFTGDFTIESTGAYTATSATATYGGNFTIVSGGTFTNSSGTSSFTGSSKVIVSDQAFYDVSVEVGGDVTADYKLIITGARTGSITNDQTGATTLSMHDLTISGTLHAKYGGVPFNTNSTQLISIVEAN